MLKCTIPEESDALLYIAHNTKLRVPKVYRTYYYKGDYFLEMEYIRGEPLDAAWHKLSLEEKDRVMRDLADYIKQLRELKPLENGGIGSVMMKETKDLRLSYLPFGPFRDVEDFHRFVRKNVPIEKCREIFGEDVFHCHAQKYRTTMSHSDLCLRNVILTHTGKPVLIDWEFAGWRPEYWEFTKFFYTMMVVPSDVDELFRKYFDNYPAELKAERHLWNIFDVPWSD
jgi:thiamine kinase-like enzyme